jgi:hypothetical protein
LKDNGLTKVENNVESAGSWLVGIEGGYLFALDSDFQVGRAACRYDAVGSGAMVALGAMSAARELPPHDRLERALLAAEEHACGVGGPFHILSTARES